jgi:hypothetical protein
MKIQIGLINWQRFNVLKNPSLVLLCCLCATAIAATQSVATVASTTFLSSAFAQPRRVDDPDDRLSDETRRELARARQATLLFHDKAQAEDSQYVDVNLFVSGQGFHFVNFGLLNGTFNPAKPQILVYAPTSQGRLRLVAVEYAVPIALSPEAPAGFAGENDAWHQEPDALGGVWVLHAWVWQANPKGIFADNNPNVP